MKSFLTVKVENQKLREFVFQYLLDNNYEWQKCQEGTTEKLMRENAYYKYIIVDSNRKITGNASEYVEKSDSYRFLSLEDFLREVIQFSYTTECGREFEMKNNQFIHTELDDRVCIVTLTKNDLKNMLSMLKELT